MPKVIKNREIIEDQWVSITNPEQDLESTDDSTNIIVELAYWLDNKASLINRKGSVGVLLQGSDEPELFHQELDNIDLIAINFPKFGDGRGYSIARLLCERYNYPKEIRATGDVLRDQLRFMERCGFNAYALRSDRNMEEALASFSAISVDYQSDVLEKKPIYNRRP